MNKLYGYMFPVALGAFALVTTPVADSNLMISALVSVVVVTLWLGIVSFAKKTKESEQKMNLLLSSIEQQTDVVRETVTELRKNGEAVEARLKNLSDAAADFNDSAKENIKAMKASTETIVTELVKFKESNQTDNQGLLKKQEGILRLVEELVDLQNELPNEFKGLQDTISQANDDQVGIIQGVETHIYEMKNEKESYHEQLLELNGKVINAVNSRMDNVSMYIQEEATTLMNRSEEAQKLAVKEVATFGTLIKQMNELNQQMHHVAKGNQQANMLELERLTEISAALLEGVSQLTNSKSAERKKLLLVQKQLIEKFADQP
ncbi:hypothetical protein EVJ20_07430 [Exiguobacterium sp. SH0S1]|uniref:hypothetical protein n=1 Tax=Exiguobacterium sp. SH0S1 TaxID=2510949 RepID=UPI00103C0494|nr:hypothetical protein [Exiguobacterium sp. SH0S1]TCI77783.1 hypothetical protein EVJ20_07430 [Exiguobacterium sp. SH0S1]